MHLPNELRSKNHALKLFLDAVTQFSLQSLFNVVTNFMDYSG